MMVRSGARGKPVQLSKTLAAPIMALQHSGEPVPWMIPRSYAEGLRTSEMWATNTETRNNQIDTRLAVTEPGDMGKILVNNLADQLVTRGDCGTTNGIMMATDDPQTVDRFLAQTAGGLPAGTQISPQALTRLRGKKINKIMVRSPMTCEIQTGVCQKCYGLSERGKVQRIGTNVGIRTAQALAEPLTQFALSAKHGVRTTLKDKNTVSGHKGLRQMLDVPESFAHKAALAPSDGEVTNIQPAPQGGMFISIGDDQQVYTPPGYDPIVKRGQTVYAGDTLTRGTPNPAEVVMHKGLGAGRQYLVNQIQSIYKNQGLDIDRRHIELLTKAHLNRVRIDFDPQNRFTPGDLIDHNKLMGMLRADAEEMPLRHTTGKMLAENKLQYTAGTRMTPEVIEELRNAGIRSVPIATSPPEMTPTMKPIVRNPLLNPDWLARLGHRFIESSILQGAHFGEKSNIHGPHPVPAIAYGAELGEGQDGNY
jgi:DNA-directed RNA polymerase subunit beta'